jgi:hypothetical protein
MDFYRVNQNFALLGFHFIFYYTFSCMSASGLKWNNFFSTLSPSFVWNWISLKLQKVFFLAFHFISLLLLFSSFFLCVLALVCDVNKTHLSIFSISLKKFFFHSQKEVKENNFYVRFGNYISFIVCWIIEALRSILL